MSTVTASRLWLRFI